MAVKPASHLDWITTDDVRKITEPSQTKKNLGYLGNDKPTRQQFNWFFNRIDKWNKYFEAELDNISGAAPVTVTHGPSGIEIGMPAAADGVAGYISAGAQDIDGAKTFLGDLTANQNLDVIGNLDVSGTVLFRGNFEVQGSFTYLNVQDLQVEDRNIDLNYGGTTASAAGAGISVLGDANAVIAGLKYDPALNSKWKLGAEGAESEAIVAAGRQTVTGRKLGNGFVPAGVVYPFAGRTLPADHYWCDGATYLIASEPDLYAALTWTQSVTTINGSPTVTTGSTADLAAGYAISGAGIPAGARILSITNATTFVISANATAGATVTATFAPYDQQINQTTGALYAAPAAGSFRVPDYRSLVLRGAGTSNLSVVVQLGVWQDDATAKNGLSVSNATSSVTGSTTASNTGTQSADHTHSFSATSGGMSANASHKHTYATALSTGGGSNAAVATATGNPYSNPDTSFTNIDHTHTVSGNTGTVSANHTHSIPSLTVTATAAAQTATVTGDTETRMQNKGVNYIIKN